MTRRSAVGICVFFLLGLAFLTAIPLAYLYLLSEHRRTEPFYHSPVAGAVILIRSDSHGKGFFGVSRSKGRRHKGLDIWAPVGTPVLASKSGRVSRAEWDKGYGLWVEITHPDGLQTRYAHLSEMGVQPGQWVRKGQPVGRCGKTGNAKDPSILPHVHYEIRFRESALNPGKGGLLDPRYRIVLKR